MPWLSALGGLPAIADDTREHYEAAAQATLDMADEDESVAALIAHLDVDVRAARGLLADMLGSRDQWLPRLGSGGDVDQLLSSLDHPTDSDLIRFAQAMPPGWAAVLASWVSRSAYVLAGVGTVAVTRKSGAVRVE